MAESQWPNEDEKWGKVDFRNAGRPHLEKTLKTVEFFAKCKT